MKQLLSFALILFASVGILAQGRIIEKEKFDTALLNGESRYAGKSYRTIQVIEDYQGGTKTNKSQKSVIEIQETGSRHAIFDTDQTVVRLRYESIRIGDVVYTRSDNAPWKEVRLSEVKRETKPIPKRRSSVAEQQVEYRFLGIEKLNNEETSVFQKVQNSRIVDSLDNSEMFLPLTTTCWYGKDGRILKLSLIHI